MDDPHGDWEKNEEEKRAALTIYGTKVDRNYKTFTAFSQTRAGIVFAASNYLKYVYIRNAYHREVIINNFVLIYPR